MYGMIGMKIRGMVKMFSPTVMYRPSEKEFKYIAAMTQERYKSIVSHMERDNAVIKFFPSKGLNDREKQEAIKFCVAKNAIELQKYSQYMANMN